MEMRGFQQAKAELEGLGARVVGVSADTAPAQGAFAEANGIEFSLLSDWPENQTMRAFGADSDGGPTAVRVTFVFDADGVLRAVIDDASNMQAHPDGALAAVREIAG